MRTAYESLTAIRAVVAELDPVLVKTTLHGNVRGGLPGSSTTDGRGSSEPALPGSGTLTDNDTALSLFDATDQELLATIAAYDALLDDLADAALQLRKFQRDVLYRELIPPRKPKSKTAVVADLRAAAMKHDVEHELPPGTTWAREQGTSPPPKAPKVEWCLSCIRVKGNLSSVADEKRGGKDCTLCRWCLDHSRSNGGKWPPLEFIEARAQGRPVRVKVKPS